MQNALIWKYENMKFLKYGKNIVQNALYRLSNIESSNITKMSFRDEGMLKIKCPWNLDNKYFVMGKNDFEIFFFVAKIFRFFSQNFEKNPEIFVSKIFRFSFVSRFSDFQKK